MAVELIVGAVLGAALTEGVMAMTSSPKSPSQTAPATPDQSKANTNAASTVADQRAAMLASGGQTDYTGGLGVLTGSDVSKSGLIGG